MAVVPRIGTEFAGYRIEALLGRGGMSVVYRAENARLGNKVALKLLAEELAQDESFRERFVRESRTAATLNHPNIVTIYDAGDEDGVLYIAMRYVDSDLKQRLSRNGPLGIGETVAIMAQVGSALDAAHVRGLLHRDVKPANILLDVPTEPGGLPHAYLADFGLTKHLESRSGITASGQFVGTIDYMSPEQIEGRDVDGRTDIYSLGCVLFECLAGATPFRRETEVAVLWAHMRDEPPPLTEIRPELPGAVDLVIARAVAKDPANRYATAHDLVDELRAALHGVSDARTRVAGAGQPAIAVDPAPAADERPQRRRPRVPAALVGGIAALAIGTALGFAAHAAFFEPDPQIVAAEGTTLTPDDRILFRFIPERLRESCHPSEPLTFEFSSSVVCNVDGRDVTRVEYNRPKSNVRMRRHFEKRAIGEGVAFVGEDLRPSGDCGHPPALREWHAANGEAGHRPRVGDEEPHGRFLCYRQSGWAAMDWTDNRIDIYATAYGRDLGRLYQWWLKRAGPIAADYSPLPTRSPSRTRPRTQPAESRSRRRPRAST